MGRQTSFRTIPLAEGTSDKVRCASVPLDFPSFSHTFWGVQAFERPTPAMPREEKAKAPVEPSGSPRHRAKSRRIGTFQSEASVAPFRIGGTEAHDYSCVFYCPHETELRVRRRAKFVPLNCESRNRRVDGRPFQIQGLPRRQVPREPGILFPRTRTGGQCGIVHQAPGTLIHRGIQEPGRRNEVEQEREHR